MRVRSLVAHAIPLAFLLLLMLADVAFGQGVGGGTVADAHNRACTSATNATDAVLQVAGPFLGAAILLGIIASIFGFDKLTGLLHHAMSIVGGHIMSFVLAMSAGAIGATVLVANGLTACP